MTGIELAAFIIGVVVPTIFKIVDFVIDLLILSLTLISSWFVLLAVLRVNNRDEIV